MAAMVKEYVNAATTAAASPDASASSATPLGEESSAHVPRPLTTKTGELRVGPMRALILEEGAVRFPELHAQVSNTG